MALPRSRSIDPRKGRRPDFRGARHVRRATIEPGRAAATRSWTPPAPRIRGVLHPEPRRETGRLRRREIRYSCVCAWFRRRRDTRGRSRGAAQTVQIFFRIELGGATATTSSGAEFRVRRYTEGGSRASAHPIQIFFRTERGDATAARAGHCLPVAVVLYVPCCDHP